MRGCNKYDKLPKPMYDGKLKWKPQKKMDKNELTDHLLQPDNISLRVVVDQLVERNAHHE